MEPCCCRDRWSPAAYSSSDGGTEESLGSVPAWSPTRRGGGDARESLGLPPSWRGGHAPGGDAKVCPGPGCQGAHVSHCVHAGCCLLLRRKERRLPPRLLLRPRLEICQGGQVDKGYYGATGSPCHDEGETRAREIPVVGFRVGDTGDTRRTQRHRCHDEMVQRIRKITSKAGLHQPRSNSAAFR